jgi:hypothetical protein
MPELAMAARVGDTIAHSPLLGLALTGIAVGLAIGIALVALTIATGGADLVVGGVVVAEGASLLATVGATLAAVAEALGLVSTLCTATAAVYTFASWLGSKFAAAIPTGDISAGAATVFIGAGIPAAARYQDPVDCQEPVTTYMGAMLLGAVAGPVGVLAAAAITYANSAHTGATIAQGSETVLTEGKSQSRVGDKTSCGGTISTGCDSVFVGGPPNAEVSAGAELPATLVEIMEGIDRVGVITGLLSGIGGLAKLIAKEGWKFALWSVEGGQEVLFGAIDTGLWAYEQHLKHQAEELEREGRSGEETTETRERKERGEKIRSGLESVKLLRDAVRHIREKH